MFFQIYFHQHILYHTIWREAWQWVLQWRLGTISAIQTYMLRCRTCAPRGKQKEERFKTRFCFQQGKDTGISMPCHALLKLKLVADLSKTCLLTLMFRNWSKRTKLGFTKSFGFVIQRRRNFISSLPAVYHSPPNIKHFVVHRLNPGCTY